MQVQKVKLPSDQLIPYLKFCRLIADAIQPLDEEIKGIKCVKSKIYLPESPSLGFGVGVPYKLDDNDSKSLAKLLPKLPPLSGGMSEADIDLFMQAYLQLPNRPKWIPVVRAEKTAFEKKYEHSKLVDLHLQIVREERVAGRLVTVDANHIAMDAVQIGAYLSRQAAIAYLDRHGLAYEEVDTEEKMAKSTEIGEAKLSQSDRISIVERHKIYKVNKVRNRTALLAREFDVSTRTISDVVKKAKEEEEKKKRDEGVVISPKNITSSWPKAIG